MEVMQGIGGFMIYCLVAQMLIALAEEGLCFEPVAVTSHVLLQKSLKKPDARLVSETQKTMDRTMVMTVPSGEHASLDQAGYGMVAASCCHEQMKVFIERVIAEEGFEVCEPFGLEGIIPWHTCIKGPGSFASLIADLSRDAEGSCPWLSSGACKPYPGPPACPSFLPEALSPSCGCSNSRVAKFNVDTELSQSNLGGKGPDSGAEEMRIVGKTGVATSAGITSEGKPFDIVITSQGQYEKGKLKPIDENFWIPAGKHGGIMCASPGETKDKIIAPGTCNLRFSFVEPGTSIPVTLSEFHIEFRDLDFYGPYNNATESVSTTNIAGYVTISDTTVAASKSVDGATVFSGTQWITRDPNKTGAVMIFFKNVSSIDLTLSNTWPAKHYRGFGFFLSSALEEKCGA